MGDSAARAKAEKCPGEGRWGSTVITLVAWRCHRSWVAPCDVCPTVVKSCLQEEPGVYAGMQEQMNPWRWQNPGCKAAPLEFPYNGFKATLVLEKHHL